MGRADSSKGRSSGGTGGPAPRGGRGGGCSRSFSLLLIIIIVTLCLFFGMFIEPSSGSNSVSEAISALSSSSREKLDLDITYTEDCVIDELEWIDDEEGLAGELRYFYEETGIQPYIWLRAYDETLTSDDEKLAFAEEWYEANIDNEGTFLFVYFAEENADEGAGYMCCVSGGDIGDVMDDEAIEVFWEKIDAYWDSDQETADIFAAVYEETADEIMAGSGDAIGIARIITTLAAVLVLIVFAVSYIQGRRAS